MFGKHTYSGGSSSVDVNLTLDLTDYVKTEDLSDYIKKMILLLRVPQHSIQLQSQIVIQQYLAKVVNYILIIIMVIMLFI